MCWGSAHCGDSDLEKKYDIQYTSRNGCVYGIDKNYVGAHRVDINLLIGYEIMFVAECRMWKQKTLVFVNKCLYIAHETILNVVIERGIIGWKYVMGGRMNFIICDDSQRDRKNLIELLKSYAKEKEQKNA